MEEVKTRKEEVDALLSQAMTDLTFEEREKQQEFLHGVDGDLAEEANMIEKALTELDQDYYCNLNNIDINDHDGSTRYLYFYLKGGNAFKAATLRDATPLDSDNIVTATVNTDHLGDSDFDSQVPVRIHRRPKT